MYHLADIISSRQNPSVEIPTRPRPELIMPVSLAFIEGHITKPTPSRERCTAGLYRLLPLPFEKTLPERRLRQKIENLL
jgi:hypothetical protein